MNPQHSFMTLKKEEAQRGTVTFPRSESTRAGWGRHVWHRTQLCILQDTWIHGWRGHGPCPHGTYDPLGETDMSRVEKMLQCMWTKCWEMNSIQISREAPLEIRQLSWAIALGRTLLVPGIVRIVNSLKLAPDKEALMGPPGFRWGWTKYTSGVSRLLPLQPLSLQPSSTLALLLEGSPHVWQL